MDITYKIEFYSYWQCGSGLAKGADVDSLAIKDREGLPYIPGKTIKGLVKEALTDISKYKNIKIDLEYNLSQMFFSNASLSEKEQETILKRKLCSYLYRSVAMTAIDENGTAEEASLRRIEVVVPCTLEGKITDVPKVFEENIKNAFKYIKRLGTDRNRGLGRCSISIIDDQQA